MIVAAYSATALIGLVYLLWACDDFRLIYLTLGGLLVLMLIYLPFGDLRIALLAILLLATLLVPALRLVVRDLRNIGSQLGLQRMTVLALRSLFLWLPIALAAVACFLLVGWRNAAVTAQVYDIEVPSRWTGACARLVCEDDAPDLRRDLHAATDRVAAATRATVADRLRGALDELDTRGTNAAGALRTALFDARTGVFPASFERFTGIAIPGCVWPLALVWPPEMAGCAKRMVLQPMDSAYQQLRSDLRDEINSHIDSFSSGLKEGTDDLDREIMAALERDLDIYAAASKTGIDRAFQIGWILAILTWISVAMVLSKTFLIILARFVFDHRTGGVALSLSFSPAGVERQAIEGRDITRTDGAFGYLLPLNGEIWFGSFGLDVRPDEHGRPTFPGLSQLLLQRLLCGKLRMQRFDPDRFDHLGGQADHSARFVRVDLRKGDRLCFQLPRLAAFSDGIAFRGLLNLKLAAMLQHRMFFPVACGSGSLVLRVDGGSMRIMPRDSREGADPMDMAAFDLDGAFELRAQHDFMSVYSEGYTVVPDERTFVIRHAPNRLVSQAGKTLRKALFFVLPI